jgi:hypothetical protein
MVDPNGDTDATSLKKNPPVLILTRLGRRSDDRHSFPRSLLPIETQVGWARNPVLSLTQSPGRR